MLRVNNQVTESLKRKRSLIAKEADIIEELPFYIRWAAQILTSMPNKIPHHIAFIMDGNRRFARARGQQVLQGHKAGFDKLGEVLMWCRLCRVKMVTVYAFSLENFKRSKDEVSGLMQLFEDTCRQLKVELARAKDNKIQIKIVGETHLLPQSTQEMIQEIHDNAPEEVDCVFNVCIAYTGRQEIVNALDRSQKSENGGTLDQFMDIPPADILLRTSGEARLSDFMLYQCFQSERTRLCFVQSLWPDFTFYEFARSYVEWQVFNSGS